MAYYPIYLDIDNRCCLVVGGGAVGTRKARTLLAYGAKVTVVSLRVTDALQALSDRQSIVLKKRAYRESDLDGMFIAIGATDDETLNRRISKDARKRNVTCNIVDRPELCDFIVPAIIKRGDLILAVSTSGKSPAFAKQLRKRLEKQFGEEYAEFLRLMGAVRKKLLAADHEPEAHKELFNRIIEEGLVDLIRDKETARINAVLLRVFGEGFDLDTLLGQAAPESRQE